MIARCLVLVLIFAILSASCKDKSGAIISKTPPAITPAIDKGVDTTKKKQRTAADLARIYGVTITRAGDTLLPQIPKDSIHNFLIDYGKNNPENIVVMKTRHGSITMELFRDMPLERASFIFLVKHNFFSHSVVHRVARNFVIQAGNSDNLITAMKRSSIGDYKLPPHYKGKYRHVRGMVSLAKQWDDNPEDLHSPFEFFISLGTAPHLNDKHTIFGRVTSGMDVADAISKEPTGQSDWPLEDVYIEMSVAD